MELANYALAPEKSRGRMYADFTNVIRSPFQRDRDRLIHSSAFRRLDGKRRFSPITKARTTAPA